MRARSATLPVRTRTLPADGLVEDESMDGPATPLSPRSLLEGARRISQSVLRQLELPAAATPREKFRQVVHKVIHANRIVHMRGLRLQWWRERAAMRETLRQRQLMAQAHLREKRAITAAQYYLLTAATVLLVLGVLVYLIITSLKLLARVEVVWWLTRSAKLDDFRRWTAETCTDPWNDETVLCQAVEGSWLARELIRAKLQQGGGQYHCDPDIHPDGCSHTPCATKGLSRALLGVADGWGSPLNNRLAPTYYALLPIRSRLKKLLHSLANGTLPLSHLEREVHSFPLLNRKMFRDGKQTTRDFLLSDVVLPIVRDWGVHIGGAPIKASRPDECASSTLETMLSTKQEAARKRERTVLMSALVHLGGGAKTSGALLRGLVRHTAKSVRHAPLIRSLPLIAPKGKGQTVPIAAIGAGQPNPRQ